MLIYSPLKTKDKQGRDRSLQLQQVKQSNWDVIEGQFRTPLGRVQVVRGTWDWPIDESGTPAEHHLELNLLPIPGGARARFVDYWAPNRFEPFGEMFFLPARQQVHFKSNCREQNSVTCDIDPEALDSWLGQKLEWRDNLLRNVLDLANNRIRSLLFQIADEIRTPGFASDTMIELLVSQIVIELTRHLKGVGEKGVSGKLSSRQLRLIDNRLSDISSQPSLGELAALCNLSVRHLTRAFRNSRDCSLGRFIAQRRVHYAKQLIASGMSIKSVAYTMGFSAPSNFTAAFLRVTGETPSQYRGRICSDRTTIYLARKQTH